MLWHQISAIFLDNNNIALGIKSFISLLNSVKKRVEFFLLLWVRLPQFLLLSTVLPSASNSSYWCWDSWDSWILWVSYCVPEICSLFFSIPTDLLPVNLWVNLCLPRGTYWVQNVYSEPQTWVIKPILVLTKLYKKLISCTLRQ